MDQQTAFAEQFERTRAHLRAVAFRMLGSMDEADDAVQEAWLRASRADVREIDNLAGWLTTIVSRVCLDQLRARARRREDLADMAQFALTVADGAAADPEGEMVMADAVGFALLVVLDRLAPAERIAFVLHDLFGVPFDEIAAIVDRTPVAAKKLASRARLRVRGTPVVSGADLDRQRTVVDAFLAASRAGDLGGLLAVLDPDVVRRADRAALRDGKEPELRGARCVAEETRTNAAPARFARLALVDGRPGIVVAPGGRLRLVIALAIDGDRITSIDVMADPARLAGVVLAVFDHVPNAQ